MGCDVSPRTLRMGVLGLGHCTRKAGRLYPRVKACSRCKASIRYMHEWNNR